MTDLLTFVRDCDRDDRKDYVIRAIFGDAAFEEAMRRSLIATGLFVGDAVCDVSLTFRGALKLTTGAFDNA